MAYSGACLLLSVALLGAVGQRVAADDNDTKAASNQTVDASSDQASGNFSSSGNATLHSSPNATQGVLVLGNATALDLLLLNATVSESADRSYPWLCVSLVCSGKCQLLHHRPGKCDPKKGCICT